MLQKLVYLSMPLIQSDLGQLSFVFQNLFYRILPVMEVSAEKILGDLASQVHENGIGFDQKCARRLLDFFPCLGDSDVGEGADCLFFARENQEQE